MDSPSQFSSIKGPPEYLKRGLYKIVCLYIIRVCIVYPGIWKAGRVMVSGYTPYRYLKRGMCKGMGIQHQGMYTRLFEKRSGMGTGVYTIRGFEEGYVYGMNIQHQGMYTRLFEKGSGMGTRVYTIRVWSTVVQPPPWLDSSLCTSATILDLFAMHCILCTV